MLLPRSFLPVTVFDSKTMVLRPLLAVDLDSGRFPSVSGGLGSLDSQLLGQISPST